MNDSRGATQKKCFTARFWEGHCEWPVQILVESVTKITPAMPQPTPRALPSRVRLQSLVFGLGMRVRAMLGVPFQASREAMQP